MSELTVGTLSGLAANSYVIDVASGSSLDLSNGATLPAGSIVQVVSTAKTDAFTTTSTSFVDITGLSASITPTNASNKVLVMVSVALGNTNNSGAAAIGQVLRDATAIGNNATGRSMQMLTVDTGGNKAIETKTVVILDSPATTSATTYKVQLFATSGSTATVNRSGASATVVGVSSITLLEVVG